MHHLVLLQYSEEQLLQNVLGKSPETDKFKFAKSDYLLRVEAPVFVLFVFTACHFTLPDWSVKISTKRTRYGPCWICNSR